MWHLLSFTTLLVAHITGGKSFRQHTGIVHTQVMNLINSHNDNCNADNSCPESISEGPNGSKGNNNGDKSDEPGFLCENGMSADFYPCSNIDMYSHVPLSDLGGLGLRGNDIWGWTTGSGKNVKEYALAGTSDGTSFVDVSDPSNPNVIAFIEGHTNVTTVWRDMKIYQDYVYIVQDGTLGHGLQYVNLPNLISKAKKNKNNNDDVYTLSSDDSDNGKESTISNCHNVYVNEDTGYLYAVGSDVGMLYCYLYSTFKTTSDVMFLHLF